MVKAVVFDCFGVLYNDAYREFFAAHAGQMGRKRPHFEELSAKVDRGDVSEDTLCDELSQVTGVAAAEISGIFNDTSKCNQPVIDIVRRLQPHYALGILSNTSRQALDHFLQDHGIAAYFRAVVASSDSGILKPDPRSFAQVASQLGVDQVEMILVDDSTYNVRAAQALGITGIVYVAAPQLSSELQAVLPVY